MYVVDTSVAAELMRPEPMPAVVAWIAERDAEELYLTAVSAAELLYGVSILPAGRRRRRVRVPEVMNAQFCEAGQPAQLSPLVVGRTEEGIRLLARDHSVVAGNLGKHFIHRGRERHHACARLTVAQPQLSRCAVDIVPLEIQDLAFAAAGQHQQTDRRNRRRMHRAAGLRLIEHRAEAPNSSDVRKRSCCRSG